MLFFFSWIVPNDIILVFLSVPDDFNRVLLSTSPEAEDSSDYINASYINVSKSLI